MAKSISEAGISKHETANGTETAQGEEIFIVLHGFDGIEKKKSPQYRFYHVMSEIRKIPGVRAALGTFAEGGSQRITIVKKTNANMARIIEAMEAIPSVTVAIEVSKLASAGN